MPSIVARHWPTEWNAEGRLQWHRNSSLTPEWRETPKAIWETLKIEEWLADFFVSSDLWRTRDTSHIIAPIIWFNPSKIVFDSNLRELCFWILEGTAKDERNGEKYKHIQDSREKDKGNYRIPEWESYRDLDKRVWLVMDKINHTVNNLFVSHEGTGRMLVKKHLGLSMVEALSISQPNNIIYRIDWDKIEHRDVLAEWWEWREGYLTR